MEFDWRYFIEGIFRWAHVVAGILWIGLLYFFNWVNAQFAPLMKELDAESKKKVLPELLPRALYWFRWGAAWTWATGVVLMILVFYGGADLYADNHKASHAMIPLALLGLAIALALYDVLVKTVLKDLKFAFWGGLVLASLVTFLLHAVAGFSFRGYLIHLGAMFGTFMAFNVWYRIWPAQKRILRALKRGEAPNPDDAALAGLRSKHNTYMSFPLVFTMLNGHMVWAASCFWWVPAIIFIGWSICWMLYKRSARVKDGYPSFLPEG